jgi:ABC-type multidrug transport system fused ATPase/permease subunit
LLALPLAYFQARRVGDSVARVRELEHIRSFLTGSSLTLVLDVLFSVIFVGVMLLYSVPLTLIVLASLPLYVGLSLAVVPLLRRRLDEKFARGAANQALLVEAITGIQTVKASALEPQLSKRWDDQLAVYVITSGDVLVEASGAGTDTVLAGSTYTLLTNFENLSLTGSSLINGTGNTAGNLLTGNSANNTLSGLGGNDTYIGGGGNDTLTDNSTTSNDIYRWGVGQGNDTINDAGGTGDRIEIAAGVAASQVTLTRSGNNLLVGITGATDVLTVANWYVGTANKIEEVRLADGTVIGAGAAPLSLARLPSASERMFRLADPTLSASPANDAALLTSAQSLVQAMAQFDAGAGADQPWVPRERYDPLPMMHVGW